MQAVDCKLGDGRALPYAMLCCAMQRRMLHVAGCRVHVASRCVAPFELRIDLGSRLARAFLVQRFGQHLRELVFGRLHASQRAACRAEQSAAQRTLHSTGTAPHSWARHGWARPDACAAMPCRTAARSQPCRASADPGQCHASAMPVPHRASAMRVPGQCHTGPVPCRASAGPGQCHTGPVPNRASAGPVPCRASAMPGQCGERTCVSAVHRLTRTKLRRSELAYGGSGTGPPGHQRRGRGRGYRAVTGGGLKSLIGGGSGLWAATFACRVSAAPLDGTV